MKIFLLLIFQLSLAYTFSLETHTLTKKKLIIHVPKAVESKKSALIKKSFDKIDSNKLTKVDLDIIKNDKNNVTPFAFDKKNIAKFLEATGTIILAGLFDRSFFITTLMAIKYSKTIVLISASGSLTLIGIIAVYLGITINKYIPGIWIESIAVCLFLAFGGHMIYDAINMKNDSFSENLENEIGGEIDSERNNHKNVTNVNVPIDIKEDTTEGNNNSKCIVMENSQKSIEIKAAPVINENYYDYNALLDNNNKLNDCENSKSFTHKEITEKIQIQKEFVKNGLLTMLYNNETLRVFVKVFILIFFSEIGDRSQISTIYLTTTFDKFIVLLGVIFSSIFLSILAVFGGNLISNKISEKNLTIIAGASFLLFGIGALFMLIFEGQEN